MVRSRAMCGSIFEHFLTVDTDSERLWRPILAAVFDCFSRPLRSSRFLSSFQDTGMDTHLRAGVAVYNEGEHHAAHDAWEELWLELESGTDDERLLHGLIQFTAAVFHARNRNWSGAVGLADSGREYLQDLPDGYRDVDVQTARSYLTGLAADPERIERARPAALTIDGETLLFNDLDVEAAIVAARVIAEEYGYDELLLDQAGTYAQENLEEGETTSPFVTLVFGFLRTEDRRDSIYQRLEQQVQQRETPERDEELS